MIILAFGKDDISEPLPLNTNIVYPKRCMKNKRKHITKEERFCIEKMLQSGHSNKAIAHTLERGTSTLSEEINRNGGRAHYNAEKAHHRAYVQQWRKKRGCLKVAMDPFLVGYVEKELRRFVSPERISGRLEKQYNKYASAKAIRKFAHDRGLESFLYRKGKTRKYGYLSPIQWVEGRIFVDDVRCIREGYGHWEGDFIVSSYSKAVLLVLTERLTKRTIVRWLPSRNNDLVREVVVSALSVFSVKSITIDNDIAFVKHQALSLALHAPVYFTRPFRSTDKALVENTNRWIRWFIKKKTDLATVTQDRIEWVEHWLNTVPRQCLNFATADEVVVLEELKMRCSY